MESEYSAIQDKTPFMKHDLRENNRATNVQCTRNT